jgi:drug/metabolite transporter (DMT)-like permease
MLLSVLFAACAACANALASVLQRKAARSAPPEDGHGARLILHQLRRPAFFGGIAGLIAGFLLQAAALSQGRLSVVQPVLAGELPLTLFIAGLVFKRPLGRREWLAAGMMTAGLAAALLAAAPSAGDPLRASGPAWAVTTGASLTALGPLAVAGWRSSGPRRAALLGTVAGGLFGLTAAFMSAVTAQARHGLGTLVGSWQVYATVATGAAAVYMLQPAFQAGRLATVPPGVTLADPVLAVVLGVVLFGEHVRLGWPAVAELLGLAGIVVGVVLLARSPLLEDEQTRPADTADTAADQDGRRAAHAG